MTDARLRELLAPFVAGAEAGLPENLYSKLGTYLELLVRWNARTNLTAVREPEEMVTRHFGEGVFTALQIRELVNGGARLLDVGSGAGFPGLPIQLVLPELSVTLAESQGKKASFLREAVRVLGCGSEVWGDRVEAMPESRQFEIVTLRAVDKMAAAMDVAAGRLAESGIVAELTVASAEEPIGLILSGTPSQVPGSRDRVLRLWKRE